MGRELAKNTRQLLALRAGDLVLDRTFAVMNLSAIGGGTEKQIRVHLHLVIELELLVLFEAIAVYNAINILDSRPDLTRVFGTLQLIVLVLVLNHGSKELLEASSAERVVAFLQELDLVSLQVVVAVADTAGEHVIWARLLIFKVGGHYNIARLAKCL